MRDETVQKLSIGNKHEVNLPAVLMMYELLIHKIIKKNEVSNMTQITSYQLTTNTEVN